MLASVSSFHDAHNNVFVFTAVFKRRSPRVRGRIFLSQASYRKKEKTLNGFILRHHWCLSSSSFFRLRPFSLQQPVSQMCFCFCVLAIRIVTLAVKSVLSEPASLHMASFKRFCVIVLFFYTAFVCCVHACL